MSNAILHSGPRKLTLAQYLCLFWPLSLRVSFCECAPSQIAMVFFFFHTNVVLSRRKLYVNFYVPKSFVLWHLHLLHCSPVTMRAFLAVVKRKNFFTVARCFWS